VWYQSEYLALEIRAGGSAIATTACWVANLVISVAYLSQLNSLGAPGTYGLYLGFVAMGYIFIVFCYPESKGLSLDEVQNVFSDGFGIKKAHLMLEQKKEISQRLREEGQAIHA
jgi:SP family myo-inositol transporter-like MFS transporter 13